ncbi:site-specific integrase [Ferirhizobium litorale]|uniref:Site-specific integrase n=1 Tax=Ferirhizobium litorale TaxID=2927786 RepID=A0AAE3Q7P5_9HYPH|nr:site-specific integrase [Fererhizobium litorale]MDI7920702.1 site-specific integrase [Fererhizobium litorale]
MTGRNMSNQYRLYSHPNGYFYHRVKVPADIRHLYGKQIEQRSLRTRDYRDALRRLPAVIVEVDRAFALFRARYADEMVAGNRDSLHGVLRPPRKDIKRAADLPKLSVISDECFKAIGRVKKWSAKTEVARRTHIKQVIEICGDKPLNRYTQSDIRLLKETLFSIPPQSHGKSEFKGLPKAQIAAEARKQDMQGLSVESVRQVLTAANIVFGWARAEYDIGLQNIVQPMIPRPSVGGSRNSKRQGFTSSELQKLFRSPVFVGVESEAAWFRPGKVHMQHTGRFWVPLLALYAGARLMEAVQLLQQDVGHEHDVWYVDINRDDEEQTGKRVKNDSSIRRIPVHPTLINLGFLDFVGSVPAGQRLFPDIEIGPATQRHRQASKMFNKLLSVAGIKGPKKVWHSLRHSFEQACRDSGVDSAIMDQLQGHVQKGMRGVYGEGYGLPALSSAIQSIRYKSVDLSHIQPFANRR